MSAESRFRRPASIAAIGTAAVIVAVMMWRMRAAGDTDATAAPLAGVKLPSLVTAAASARANAAEPGEPAPTAGVVVDWKRTASAAFERGDFDGAEAQYIRILAAQAEDADALNGLGQTLIRLGRIDEAVSRLERAVALSPDIWSYHFNLAVADGQQGRWDRAVVEYREAARLFPDDYATAFNLGLALDKTGDHAGAIASYERAIQLAPGEASFHIALGNSLEKIGRTADAVREFRIFLGMDPSSSDADRLKAHVDALIAAGS